MDGGHGNLFSFQDLKVWEKSVVLAEEVIRTIDEILQFLYIARGSLFEVVTLLIIFQRVGWLEVEKVIKFQRLAEEITKMLNSLIKSTKKQIS
ncbi:MAG: four helix bundle protein [Desulfobacterales bacterium]